MSTMKTMTLLTEICRKLCNINIDTMSAAERQICVLLRDAEFLDFNKATNEYEMNK